MSRERPPDFADRLPRVVPKEETDIVHLSDEMVDLLYPGRRPRPFRIGVRFCRFEDPAYERAVALAQQSASYREQQGSQGLVHEAGFDAGTPAPCATCSSSCAARPGTDVLVDGKRIPYAHELWLPLFWIFLGGEA